MFLQLSINGILLGGAYALISVGLTLIFGVMRVVNFTHGELVMVGMYMAFLLYHGFGIDPYVSLFIVPIFMFLLGMLLQKLVVSRTIGAPHEVQIFTTVGLGLILSNGMLALFKGDYRSVSTTYSTDTIHIGQIIFGIPQLVTFLISALITGALFVFLRYTYTGKAIRATTQNRASATLMGINIERIYLITFGIGSAMCGVASTLLIPMSPTYPAIGDTYELIAFVVVVLGGLGSIPGALIGGVLIGIIESLTAFYIDPGWKQAVYFVIFILILVLRPQGLFGQRGAESLY
jgi:branched-chain amino acid transport system permease protein